jgi:Predicted membrane protein
MEYVYAAIVILAILNVIAFLMYVSDKKKAVNGKRRTPEKTLLIVSLIGPFGALAGMKFARHKTKKTKFKLVYLFAVLHIAVVALLIWIYIL